MDPFDEIMIKNYFSFPAILKSLRRYKKRVRQEFYTRNMSTHTEFTELGLGVAGFRPDREIEKLITCLELIERRIERYSYRERHFNRYLETLSFEECEILLQRFIEDKTITLPEQLSNQLLDEIYEIEAALCYREGVEPDEKIERIELTEDIDENLERLCDFFAL